MKRSFGKIAIVGVGLIGGSIGLALRKKKLAKEVMGVGRHTRSIAKAVNLKTIDRGTLSLAHGVKGADIVIFATPVLSIPKLAKKIRNSLKKGCIVTDVGSVKTYITKELESALPGGINFVGAHPMAGSEQRGVDKARDNLFKGTPCILTKTKKTNRKALRAVRQLWRDMGSKVVIISPEAHDRFVSEISHLPHMAVFAMLNSIDKRSLRFASSGFFDTTRIASSDAKVWKDIAVSNKAEILKSINKFKASLSILEKAIKQKDAKKLLSIFCIAKKKRDQLKAGSRKLPPAADRPSAGKAVT